ncbi:Mg2+ transporter -like Zinc transport [Fusarium albosuccineum]|uniref:Mg2+ transporter -like Zinc transport n=1 Tax=Fusarium albosuccineum TaxID=1237068 RepID=A0A8H4L357_9HYPO|nr:Mg2+ transporter -like Zinc transport [Fusarium albosuccineum]
MYGSFLDNETMRTDPFYAISEILCFAAQSECQYLAHLESLVRKEVYGVQTPTDFAINNLKHTRENLGNHIQSLEEAVDFIRDRGNVRINGSTGDEIPWVKQQLLLRDFERLLARATEISTQCLEGINIITNDTILEEARKTMAQGQQTKTLTLLAFFYLPMTLAASIFGMNVVQFGQGPVSIGWPFVAIGGSLVFQWLLYVYGKRVQDSMAKWYSWTNSKHLYLVR